jgi:hypothetical protein
MPAQAGIQELQAETVGCSAWIPAFAGMTPRYQPGNFTWTKYESKKPVVS